MDRNEFKERLKKDTSDLYADLEEYLRGSESALKFADIATKYSMDTKTLKFRMMQEAVQNEKFRKLYIEHEKKKKKAIGFKDVDVAYMLLQNLSVGEYANQVLNQGTRNGFKSFVNTFQKKQNSTAEEPKNIRDEVIDILKERNKAFRQRKAYTLDPEQVTTLVVFIEKCENGDFESNKKSKEEIISEARELLQKNYSKIEIATILGIGYSTLTRYIREAGLEDIIKEKT